MHKCQMIMGLIGLFYIQQINQMQMLMARKDFGFISIIRKKAVTKSA